MYKSYKFRLYPSKKQMELIQKTFGCTRLVYNHYLEKTKMLYEGEKKYLSCFDMIKDMKNLQEEYPYLKEVDLKRHIIKLPKLKEVSIIIK